MLPLLLMVLATTIMFPGLIPVQAQDNHTKISFTEPLDETVPAAFSCSGEDVHVFGNLDFIVQTTTDSKGGLHVVTHITPHLTAIGLTSRLTYRTAGPFQSVTSTNGTSQSVSQLVNIIVLISPGSTDTLVLTETMHVTVNANGDTTVEFDNFRAVCHG
jgi:hypothetical protein